MVSFSYNTHLSTAFNEFNTIKAVDEHVDLIKNMDSVSRIDKALRLAKQSMFTRKTGARKDHPNLLVLLTDGGQSLMDGMEDPAEVAMELRQMGIQIICIGIGKQVSVGDLKRIAGNPEKVFVQPSFPAMLKNVKKIKDLMCRLGEW